MNQHTFLLAATIATIGMFCSGCAPDGLFGRPRPSAGAAPPTRVQPASTQVGVSPARIVSLSAEHGFAVIDFSARVIPAVGTRLEIYRGGKKVGAVRLTEPVRGRLTTADVLEGELRIGDEAR